MTVPGGIADNRRLFRSWTLVPNLSPDSVCLCVHGAPPCNETWLSAARAQVADDAELVLLGACASLAGHAAARRYPELDATATHDLVMALARRLPGRNLILLRSDAVLPTLAMPRLLRALDEDDVLAAGPLDNLDATRSPLPHGSSGDATTARIDAVCYAVSRRELIDATSVSPLLCAWHGGRLARVVESSAQTKPHADLRTVLLDHCYVGAEGRPLQGAEASADPRDPLPPSALAALRIGVRDALASEFVPDRPALDARPVLLHVLHGWGGGAERWVRDFCQAYTSAAHLVLVARGSHGRKRHGEWLELHDGSLSGPPLQRLALPNPIAETAIHDAAYRDLLGEWLRQYAVDAIVVSSLIGHSLDILRTGLPTLRIVHDHYPLWPVLHRDFGDPGLAFDDAQRRADLGALGSEREFANGDPAHWKSLRDATVRGLTDASAILVAPSRSALANDLRLAPELKTLQTAVIAHGLSRWPIEPPARARPPQRGRLRLLIPGRVRRGKGADLLEQVLPRVQEYADVFLLGAGAEAHAFFGRSDVHVILDFSREDLPGLLHRLAPDAAVLMPTVAETFGYLLSELRDLGMPVIATRMGAYVERIEEGVDGFLVEATADAIVARIIELNSQRERLARVRDTLAGRREGDLTSMAQAYAAVLALPDRPALRYPLARHDVLSQQLAARSNELDAASKREAQQARELRALARESRRRGEWGHDLDRELAGARTRLAELDAELAERTEWALRLDAEVNELRPIASSRMWRWFQPLRSAVTRLRDLRAGLIFRANRLLGLLRRARGSLIQHGLRGTWMRLMREMRWNRPAIQSRQTYPTPSEAFTPFSVATSEQPRVSIVIPVHNKFAYTAACLRSLQEHAAATPFEIIVVDDLSTDSSQRRLAEISGIRVLRNPENLGFVGSCNAGAALARGEFLLFLNNDTVVTAGWLEALLSVFDEVPDAGLAGARLVYPDGRVQEAGGIVFSDGSGWNYGRFEDPDDSRFAFRREVDYCSGAAILLRRSLFERLGCFDARYAPAYYEDTDLAFAVRAAGLKVIYEPRARVVHFEGITAGTDTASGMKRYQPINREKFVTRWQAALKAQPPPATPIHLAATHRARRRVLILDATTPAPDQDSGSLRMVNLMRVLLRNGCHVTFMASNRAWIERYTPDLQNLGVEVLYHPYDSDPVAFFRARGGELDVVLLSRHYVAAEFVGLTRLYAGRARLVFDTVDLHYLREQRAAELENRPDLARVAERTRAQEIGIMRECDLTLVVSPVEKDILSHDAPSVSVEVLSNVHEIHGCRNGYADRRDLVFVGGFQHPPNSDAVIWFVGEILPRVLAAIPDLHLHVIGSKVSAEIQALASEHVRVHGYVEDIAPYMDSARISVAPLRYGAGVKGKVNMAMSYGLPVVATAMAVEGMHVRSGIDVSVAEDAAGFADAIIRLYGDEALWNRLSQNGLANVREHFSFDAAEKAARRIFQF